MKQIVTALALLTSSYPMSAVAEDPSSGDAIFTLDVCPSTRAHFRNDWSLIFPLKQGRLMRAWCEYYAVKPSEVIKERSGDYTDPAACRISAKISTDKGRTWSDTFTLQDNTARLNVKHPNLLRLSSDPNKPLRSRRTKARTGKISNTSRTFPGG